MRSAAASAATLLAAVMAALVALRRILEGSRTIAGAVLHTPTDDTTIDARGAVRSVQGADIILGRDALGDLWHPEQLERVARTYWLSLSRFTFGLIGVEYTETERYIVLLHPRLRLLTFQAPEYEMNRHRGIVRWRIERGLLVAAAGRGGDGYLEIDVARFDDADGDKVRVHVEVEVANFYPAIASSIGRWVYVNTQSRLHVIACQFFLRSLVRRELDESEVGRLAAPTLDGSAEPLRARDKPRETARQP